MFVLRLYTSPQSNNSSNSAASNVEENSYIDKDEDKEELQSHQFGQEKRKQKKNLLDTDERSGSSSDE